MAGDAGDDALAFGGAEESEADADSAGARASGSDPSVASDQDAEAAKRAATRAMGAGQMLDLVPKGEGTDGPNGYDMSYDNADGKHYPLGGKKPTELTIDQAIAMAPALKEVAGHAAIGRYQLTPTTLADAKRIMNLTGSELLTPAMQDRIARELLNRSGYDHLLAVPLPGGNAAPGEIRAFDKALAGFQARLAKVWPSLGGSPGVKQFDGVRVTAPRVSAEDVAATIRRAIGVGQNEIQGYLDNGYMPPPAGGWRAPRHSG